MRGHGLGPSLVAAAGRRRPSTFAPVGATGKWNVRRRRAGDVARGVRLDARATRRHRRGISGAHSKVTGDGCSRYPWDDPATVAGNEKRRIVLEGDARERALDRGEPIDGNGRIIARLLSQRVDTDHAYLIDATVALPPATPRPRPPCFAAAHGPSQAHWRTVSNPPWRCDSDRDAVVAGLAARLEGVIGQGHGDDRLGRPYGRSSMQAGPSAAVEPQPPSFRSP